MKPNGTVLITGAAGNLGGKLRRHLEGRFPLRLLDQSTSGADGIGAANLSQWDPGWAEQFQGVAAVVHLAANPDPRSDWSTLLAPNIDGVVHVLEACVRARVPRIVYASSNHVMGGYQAEASVPRLTADLPPRPGIRFRLGRDWHDSTAYGAAKLFGERLGRCQAERHGLTFVGVRIGWVQPGANPPPPPPRRSWRPWRYPRPPLDVQEWFRLMWLSNRDLCQLLERCLTADLPPGGTIVNGMSANTGMCWDLEETRRLLGYVPQDDVTQTT